MKRISAEELAAAVFLDHDGRVVDPETTPYVLMPHPMAPRDAAPCPLCVVTEGDEGYVLLELEMDNREEAERACASVNAGMGWTEQDVDRIVFASMGGGSA